LIQPGKKNFATKKQIGEAVYQVLHAGDLGRKLAGDEHELVRALLDRHPTAEQKIGCGVVALYVRKGSHGTRCFWLRRSDGTETDFSYRECLTPTTHRTKVMAAMRHAVADQIIDFKRRAFCTSVKVPCAVSGQLLGPDDCDVDHHEPTFREIVDAFFGATGWSAETVHVMPSVDGRLGDVLADANLAEIWKGFHFSRARFRIVEKKINRSA
jgi:hypothetical protein